MLVRAVPVRISAWSIGGSDHVPFSHSRVSIAKDGCVTPKTGRTALSDGFGHKRRAIIKT